MTDSLIKNQSEVEDYRGRLVRYIPDGQLGIVVETCWFNHSIRNHYIIVLTDGSKRVVSLDDEHKLAELI